MSETAVMEQQVANATPQQVTPEAISDYLRAAQFGEEIPAATLDKPTEASPNQAATKPTNQSSQPSEQPQDDVIDNITYLKDKFGWDSEEVALQELKELREFKTKQPETPQLNFANDRSKLYYEYATSGKTKELRDFLNEEEKINTFATVEVNGDIAEDIIKFGISSRNKKLTQQEVEFQYRQEYGVPKEPVQRITETDEEFAERHAEWKERADNIEMKKTIAAKMLQPDIEKLKTELILPKIENETSSPQKVQSQEELAQIQQEVDGFINHSKKVVNDFGGIKVQVKDKDVDFTVDYSLSADEKKQIETKLEDFAKSEFNPYVLFAERWLSKDGKEINVKQIAEDYARVIVGNKAEQKIATDAANQRLEAYLKGKKQTNVTNQYSTNQNNIPAQNGQENNLVEGWLNS